MELHSTQPSSVMENGTELNTTEVEWNQDMVEWEDEISLEEAKELLDRTMYPFKKVTHTYPYSQKLSYVLRLVELQIVATICESCISSKFLAILYTHADTVAH